MNVFIVATSHNIIQVEEAIKYYKLEKKEVLLLYMHPRIERPNLNMVPEGVECLTFSHWTTRDLITSRQDYRVFVSFLRHLKKQRESFNLYSNFYTSDYVLIAASVLKPRKIVLMDEGTASIGVVLKRRNNKYHLLKCMLKSALYLRWITIPRRIVYFSQYPLCVDEPDSLERYYFEKEHNEISIDRESAIFLGQPLSEANIVNETYYLAIMSKLYGKLKDDGFKKVDYYAHRRESLNKLEKLSSLGWVIHDNNEPFEQVFKKLDPCPSAFFAFYSPVLDNLSKKYYSIPEFYMVEIPVNNLTFKSRAIITEVYSVLKRNPKLKVIKL